MTTKLTKTINDIDAVHWISTNWNKVTSYTIHRCFYKAGFPSENEQSRIQDQYVAIVCNFGSILQEHYTEIEPGAYLEAIRHIPICDNNIVEKKEDSIEETELGESNET